jgi:ferritin-like metal-binding protein YciE
MRGTPIRRRARDGTARGRSFSPDGGQDEDIALMPVSDAILAEAFHRTLKEVCFTEKLSARAHGHAARKARSAALRQAMQAQRDESASRVLRLNQVFGMIGKSARAQICAPIRDMTTEMEAYLDDAGEALGADTIVICWAQQIEAYWIGRYGTLKEWSSKLGLPDAEDAIGATLDEVNRAAALLARVADDIATEGHRAAGA